MTKRINQPSTVVVPANAAHVPEGAAPASKVAATAAAAEAAAKAAAVTKEEGVNETVIAAAAPAPLAMVAQDAATAPAQDTTTTTTTSTAPAETDDGTADDATPYIVGGVLLAGGVLAIALSGGDDDDTPAPAPTPTPTPTNTAPTFAAATATAAANENVATTATVFTAVATDAQAQAITYTLGGADAALFAINATTGVVTFRASPNFEATPTKTSYTFTVTATDSAGLASTPQTVTLTLNNVNEAPTFANATATVSVPENTSTATAIVTGGATDPDANTALRYTLTGADAALFAVNEQTGAVTFRASPDFEATPTRTTFNFNLVASDAATGGLSATQAVTVNLTDVPEGIVLAGTQTLSAAGANVQYIESAATPNTTTINGFGVGDTITVDVPTSSYSFSNNGADLLITFANNGVVNQITLVGAVSANAVVTTEAQAEQAVGSNFFLPGANVPTPPASGTTIDGAGAQPTYNAANAAVTYTENAGVPNTTTISNFGSDDRIVIQGATSGYSFSNTSTDILIDFANNGVVNQIRLVGVVGNPNAVVTTEAQAEQLLGFDFFRYA